MFRSAGITFGSKLLVALVNFGIVILLSQWLGDAGKGQCSLYLFIFSAALIFSECISGSTVVVLLSRYSHRQLLVLFYSWSAVAGIFTGVLFWWPGKLSAAETGWVMLLNWLNAVAVIHQLIALGRQKMKLFNGLNISQSLLSLLALLIIFHFFKKEPVKYLWALCAAWAVVAIAGFYIVYFFHSEKPFAPWKSIARAGFRAGVANQAGTFMQLINTRIAYLLLPPAGTGIFSNAVSLCEACLLINNSIGTVQYSRIAAMADTNEPLQKIRQQQVLLTQQCFWANTLLMLVALTVLALIPAQFYGWLFGPGFEEVALPLRLLLPGIFLYSGYIILSYFFSGTGRFMVNNFPALAALLVTLLGYGAARIIAIPLSIPLVSLITVCSYGTLFLMAMLIFLQQEKISLKQWLKVPGLKKGLHRGKKEMKR